MLHTIIMGSCVSVQGFLVGKLPDGRIQVRVGSQIFSGKPVNQVA